MESPNKGEDKAPTSHLSLPSEFSVPRMSCILLLGKGGPMEIPEQLRPLPRLFIDFFPKN